MSKGQYTKPLVVEGETAIPLERIEFDDTSRNEDWLQELLFKHPELIPFEELDPLFRNSVPVAREVESGSGPIDILYVNADGLLTIVETKLWRNPQSRREAVAQIINYAAVLSKATYEQLSQAVDETTESKKDLLVEAARSSVTSFDEQRFHDGLSQNLRHGRFLLLIIGDGIREDVDDMAEFLSRQPNLGFTLRLIEMAMYRLAKETTKAILVQPQIIARTREIVRAIVKVEGSNVVVDTPPEPVKEAIGGGRFKIAPEQFYQLLADEVPPSVVDFVKWMVEHAPDHRLKVQWMQAGPVFKFFHETGDFFTLFQFTKDGWLAELGRFWRRCDELELPENIWTDYFDAIVKLIPGASRKHHKSEAGNEVDDIVIADSSEPLQSLMNNKAQWLEAIDLAVRQVDAAVKSATGKRQTTR